MKQDKGLPWLFAKYYCLKHHFMVFVNHARYMNDDLMTAASNVF